MITNRYLTGTTNSQTENKMRNDLYPRPEGALMLSDIKVNMLVYRVYGYSFAKGEISSEILILSEPLPYKETEQAKYDFKKSTLEKDIFFDSLTILAKETYISSWDNKPTTLKTRPMFVDDLSLNENIRYNNNFIFADKELAQKYADFVESKRL